MPLCVEKCTPDVHLAATPDQSVDGVHQYGKSSMP